MRDNYPHLSDYSHVAPCRRRERFVGQSLKPVYFRNNQNRSDSTTETMMQVTIGK
jgi:hypothetical protein